MIPNILDQRAETEGSTVNHYFDFDKGDAAHLLKATGFLNGSFIYDSGRSIAFFDCHFSDGSGNMGKEYTKTQSGALPSQTYCSSTSFPNPVGTDNDAFGKKFTYQNGQLLTARWIIENHKI